MAPKLPIRQKTLSLSLLFQKSQEKVEGLILKSCLRPFLLPRDKPLG
ncbi:hypothetical protein SGRA_0872 [Saprospira grandis str. Lewin]|uniref:Uncharacterized protein n=1 Tax=Saprospira grandis (strain Lewin) TaxID=984262 RepID=H6L2F0_SAPGL|nr:hypothetical protein SGRA_0872 [Saprospira grandis str. Lewin]